MQVDWNDVISIRSGEVRGYNKQVVTGGSNRFGRALGVGLTGTIPLVDPKGAYIRAVSGMLDRIDQSHVGNAFLVALRQELRNGGNQVVITMPSIDLAMTCHRTGDSPNLARSGPDGFVEPLCLDDDAHPLPVLQQARTDANNAGFADAALAGSINQATLAAGIPLVVTAQQIADWCTGQAPLPGGSTLELRFLLLALERWLPSGPGAGTTVSFDPWNRLTGAHRRSPKIGLFHELVHAYASAAGRQVFSDDHEFNEHITIGVPPFDQVASGGAARPYTENTYRAAVGAPLRLDL